MRIVCPSCAAAYDVPDERLHPGQAVRCARCGNDWCPTGAMVVAPPPPEPEPEPQPEPEPPPDLPIPPIPFVTPPPDDPPVASALVPMVAAGWVLSFMALAGLTWAMVAWRVEVMRAWPPSERLFALVGLVAP